MRRLVSRVLIAAAAVVTYRYLRDRRIRKVNQALTREFKRALRTFSTLPRLNSPDLTKEERQKFSSLPPITEQDIRELTDEDMRKFTDDLNGDTKQQ